MKTVSIEFAFNMFGSLDWPLKSALYNYLEFPTEEHWNEIYSTIISPRGKMTTIWQAVLEIDPTFPKRASHDEHDNVQWEKIPSPIVVRKAIQNAVFKLNLN